MRISFKSGWFDDAVKRLKELFSHVIHITSPYKEGRSLESAPPMHFVLDKTESDYRFRGRCRHKIANAPNYDKCTGHF